MTSQEFTNLVRDSGTQHQTTVPIFRDGKYVANMDRVKAYDLADKGHIEIINDIGYVLKKK